MLKNIQDIDVGTSLATIKVRRFSYVSNTVPVHQSTSLSISYTTFKDALVAMVNIIFKLALLGLSISSVLATPTPIRSAQLARRSAIDHDAVVGFPHTVPSGSLGTLYLKYKPYLYTYNGCVPYPAVDAQGNTK